MSTDFDHHERIEVSKPSGAIIEIIEYTDAPDPDVIVPNSVRINGQELYTSADEPVIVHEVSSSVKDLVRVTVTLIAKRVTFEARTRSTDG